MIEVGEYVRTKDGRIYQVNSSNDEWALSDIFYKVIVKHSKNIIDLIEVGDYVNGNKIEFIEDGELQFNWDGEWEGYADYYEQKDIKTIVTKEQFANIEYRLED